MNGLKHVANHVKKDKNLKKDGALSDFQKVSDNCEFKSATEDREVQNSVPNKFNDEKVIETKNIENAMSFCSALEADIEIVLRCMKITLSSVLNDLKWFRVKRKSLNQALSAKIC